MAYHEAEITDSCKGFGGSTGRLTTVDLHALMTGHTGQTVPKPTFSKCETRMLASVDESFASTR